jgi:hypothetical protein
MSFAEYKKMSSQSAKYEKAIQYLQDMIDIVPDVASCNCVKCDKIEEIKAFVNEN